MRDDAGLARASAIIFRVIYNVVVGVGREKEREPASSFGVSFIVGCRRPTLAQLETRRQPSRISLSLSLSDAQLQLLLRNCCFGVIDHG